MANITPSEADIPATLLISNELRDTLAAHQSGSNSEVVSGIAEGLLVAVIRLEQEVQELRAQLDGR